MNGLSPAELKRRKEKDKNMSLDIEIDGVDDFNPLHLFIDDFNVIVDKIKSLKNCPILERNLSNYFADGEVYLDELGPLKEEILTVMNSLKNAKTDSALRFLTEFINVTDIAIRIRKTIKIIAD